MIGLSDLTNLRDAPVRRSPIIIASSYLLVLPKGRSAVIGGTTEPLARKQFPGPDLVIYNEHFRFGECSAGIQAAARHGWSINRP
jgi:hypothetical protein